MACACNKPNCSGNCGCTGKPAVHYIGELPIDNLESIADFFLAERDLEDPLTGNIKRDLVRVPGEKLFPQSNMANVAALETNNLDLKVPKGQVRAVYISNEVNTNVMRFANASHPAIMLALGEWTDLMLVQRSGFVNMSEPHEYVPGLTYYLGENGEPTSDPSITGQALFVPVSTTKLAILL